MSTTAYMPAAASPSPSPSLTLADLVRLIGQDTALPPKRRADITSALTVFAKAVGKQIDDIVATVAVVRPLLHDLSATRAGHKEGRWRNIRSLVSSALAWAGQVSVPARIDADPSPAWSGLLALLPSQSSQHVIYRLGRFARFCTIRGREPDAVDDDLLKAFGQALDAGSLVGDPAKAERETALHWNRAAAAHPAWPQRRLTVPDNRLQYTLPFDAYPESMQQDIAAWTQAQSADSNDDLDDGGRIVLRPAKPATVESRHAQLRLYLGALVLSGADPATLLTLRHAVTPANLIVAMGFMRDRRKCKKSHHLAQIARLAAMIGRHWLRLPEAELKHLKNTTSRVTPPKGGLSERNRARLQAIDDSGRLDQLLALPEWLCNDARRAERRLGARSVVLARQWQTAVAIEILLRLPLRLKNLAGLKIGHSLILGSAGSVLIVIRASDVKNEMPIETPLPPDSAAMIRTYIEKYRPLLGASGSDFLFRGEAVGTAKSHDALRKQISATIDEQCGLVMNPHLFRHLAAYLILKEHPGNYALVQRVLHHAQLSSTMQSYTGLEGAAAVAFYGELLNEKRSARRPSISPTNRLKGRTR